MNSNFKKPMKTFTYHVRCCACFRYGAYQFHFLLYNDFIDRIGAFIYCIFSLYLTSIYSE